MIKGDPVALKGLRIGDWGRPSKLSENFINKCAALCKLRTKLIRKTWDQHLEKHKLVRGRNLI